jgi:glycosyltransferase involved in cell wall biosynthesis
VKVVHLALSAGGGAGVAARRTVEALCREGVEAELWTADGAGAARGLRSPRWSGWRTRLAALPLLRYPRRKLYSDWSNAWVPSRLAPTVARARPDIVHLHWIGGGFLHLGELAKFGAPVVWTLHDAWPLTGGCHYPDDCRRFQAGCGGCPQLESLQRDVLCARNLRAKRRATAGVSRWIFPSEWLSGLAGASGAIPADRRRVIPYGYDERVLFPRPPAAARARWDLPAGARVIVAGAADLRDLRKGAALLPETVRRVQEATGRKCVLLVFGANPQALPPAPGVEIRSTGVLRGEDDVAAVLSAADLLLLPSLQDNLPNVAIEAQACGCPVVGFATGGVPETIEPGVTGLLSSETSAAGLAAAVLDWFARRPDRAETAVRCRARFEAKFTYPRHARQLAALYAEVREARRAAGNAPEAEAALSARGFRGSES